MRVPENSHFTDARVIYRWQCFICGVQKSEEWIGGPGTEILEPYQFPEDGWMVLPPHGQLCCSKHKVEVLVDGNPFYSREAKDA